MFGVDTHTLSLPELTPVPGPELDRPPGSTGLWSV